MLEKVEYNKEKVITAKIEDEELEKVVGGKNEFEGEDGVNSGSSKSGILDISGVAKLRIE